MVDNEPFAKGASKKLSVHIPAFFFLFGGREGRQGNIKMRHRCELACSPRGVLWFQMTGLIKWRQNQNPATFPEPKINNQKTHAKFPSPKNLQEEKKVLLHLIWLCFITSPPHYQASSLQVFSLGGQMFLLVYVRAIYVEIRSYYYYYLFFGTPIFLCQKIYSNMRI